MRYAIFIATLAAAAAPPRIGYAQQMTTTTATAQAEEQRVLVTEDEYVAAEVSRDEAKLRRLIDHWFVLNSSRGTASGKEEFKETERGWSAGLENDMRKLIVAEPISRLDAYGRTCRA